MCEKYKKYRKELDEKNEKINKIKDAEKIVREFKRKSLDRENKRKRVI